MPWLPLMALAILVLGFRSTRHAHKDVSPLAYGASLSMVVYLTKGGGAVLWISVIAVGCFSLLAITYQPRNKNKQRRLRRSQAMGCFAGLVALLYHLAAMVVSVSYRPLTAVVVSLLALALSLLVVAWAIVKSKQIEKGREETRRSQGHQQHAAPRQQTRSRQHKGAKITGDTSHT